MLNHVIKCNHMIIKVLDFFSEHVLISLFTVGVVQALKILHDDGTWAKFSSFSTYVTY